MARVHRGPLARAVMAAERAGVRDIVSWLRPILEALEDAWTPGGADETLARSMRAAARARASAAARRRVAEQVVSRAAELGVRRAEAQAPEWVLARADSARRDRASEIGRIVIGRTRALELLLLDVAEDAASRVAQARTTIEFDDAIDIVLRRAGLIGETETYQAVSDVDRARLGELGAGTTMTWRTQRDDLVRPEHAEREGVSFDVDDGIDGELPGDPPNCRCWAEPIWPEVSDDDL